MSTDSDKQERSRLQHEAEHERPHKRSSVLLYLVILFAAAFLLLLMSYFMQQRANQEAMDKLEQTSTRPPSPWRTFSRKTKPSRWKTRP